MNRRLLQNAGAPAGPSLVFISGLLGILLCLPVHADGEAGGARATKSPGGAGGTSTLLFVQGRLHPGAEAVYQQYVEGTGPLLAEYGASVLAVGSGLKSELTTDAWPINAVLSFPDRAKAEGFLGDPRYRKLKENYRDKAYATLHLTLVEGRAPRLRGPEDVAREAFADFRTGLAGGSWEPFLGRLDQSFTFHFPMGQYQGEHQGVEAAREFFAYVSSAFPGGLTVDQVDEVTSEGKRVVFEFHDSGKLRGAPYRNRIALSLDVCGEKICGYREYFGLVGPPPQRPPHEEEP